MPAVLRRVYLAALAASLFLFVLGARWHWLDRYGMALPESDAWDGEGASVLAPWAGGALSFSRLFQPHNEHRPVLSKLLCVSLTAANRQWDQRLEAATAAIFPAVLAAGLFLLGWRAAPRWHIFLLTFLAGAFALPLAWQNMVEGFLSQQLFLVFFSCSAILVLANPRPRPGQWTVGVLCLLLSLGTMATGFFAAFVIAGLASIQRARGERPARNFWPTLLLCGGAIAVGIASQVTVPANDSWHAKDLADFVGTLLQTMGWPIRGLASGGAAVLFWWPFALLVRELVSAKPGSATTEDYAVCGLGAWALFQFAASAYARGAGAPAPPSRYLDFILLGCAANALALARLGSRRGAGLFLPILWLVVLTGGAASELWTDFKVDLPQEREYHYYCEQNVRDYLATGWRGYLDHNEIPYPLAGVLIERLQSPLRELMPSTVRLPLRLTAQISEGFSSPGISPQTPPLASGETFGNYGHDGADWRSRPVSSAVGGWLKFLVSGDIGSENARLQINGPASTAVLAQIQPSHVPDNSWHTAVARAPAGRFAVTARVSKPGVWMAFSEPVEVGRLSYLASRIIRNGWAMCVAGAVMAAALISLCSCSSRPDVRPGA
jgi:hypothetical protein